MEKMLTWHELQARKHRQAGNTHLTVLADTWDDMQVYRTLQDTQQAVFKLMAELQHTEDFTVRFQFGDRSVHAEFEQLEFEPEFKRSYLGRFDIEVFEWVEEKGYGIECCWKPHPRIVNA